MEVSELRLKERTVLLTGPMTRVHQSLAHKLTQLGADIVMADQNIDTMQRFTNQLMEAREVNERFGRAAAVKADLSDVGQVKDAVSKTAEYFGGVDIFIDGNMSIGPTKFSENLAAADLDKVLAQNLRAPILTTQGLLPFLKGRKRGRIIFLIHDLVNLGAPGTSLYAAARTGLIGFTRALSREVAEQNITVNCLSMGMTEEYLLASEPQAGSVQNALSEVRKSYPNLQITEPDKIADTVAYLASPLAAGVTGQTLTVRQGLGW